MSVLAARDLVDRAAFEVPVRASDVRSFFQPIVDLFTGTVMGYEGLSRFPAIEASVEDVFEQAKANGQTWDVELACRTALVNAIAALDASRRSVRFFVNVSPRVFRDARFLEVFNRRELAKHELTPERIVVEVTEKDSISKHDAFEDAVARLRREGFDLALDDFGSGHSSLLALISLSPQFLKLDRAVTHEVGKHPYRQLIVRSMVGLAGNLNAALVAEGIESMDDLECLVRLGVRYAQGFLLARPAAVPPTLDPAIRREVCAMTRRLATLTQNLDETIRPFVVPVETLPQGRFSTEEVVDIVHRKHLDHLVVVDGRRPIALVTREHLFSVTGQRFGYALFQKRPVEVAAKTSPLIVRADTHVTILARIAMERLPSDLYDPIIVVDDEDGLLGAVTAKQLLLRSLELQVGAAENANPLTHLPGNGVIQGWMLQLLDEAETALVYADLDRFKEFNDTFGFVAGDGLLKLTAEVLREHVERWPQGAHLGHVGGDDFVIVCRSVPSAEALDALCEDFDRRRLAHFPPHVCAQGWFQSEDRQGFPSRVPLTSLGLAVIPRENVGAWPHPAMLSQMAASLKVRIKHDGAGGRSRHMVERRCAEP